MKTAFIGVGAMGAAMAGHAAQAGHDVQVFDLDAEAMARAAKGGVRAATLEQIAAEAEVSVVMVANDDQSRSVVEALLQALFRQAMNARFKVLLTEILHYVTRLVFEGVILLQDR